MPKARKTISVASLLFKTNFRNRFGTTSPEVRKGMNLVMDGVLVETGNYMGYSYCYPQNVPPGCAPGINDVDMRTATMEEKFDGTDPTRITFAVSRELAAEYQELQEKQNAEVEKRIAKGDLKAPHYIYV